MTLSASLPRFQVTVDLSFGELLRFQLHFLWKRFGWFLLFFTLVGLATPVAVFVSPREGRVHPGTFVPLLIVVVLVAGTYFGTRGQYRRFWATESPMTVSIGEEGIETSTRSTASKHLWSRVSQVSDTREFLLFYVDKMAAIIVPKRCIPGPANAQDIAQYARAKIRGAAK